jgi:hypothetical protein
MRVRTFLILSWIVFAAGIVLIYLTLMTAHMGGPAR